MVRLIHLPYEVLSNIVANVDFDDVFHLGSCCRALSFLLREESICKTVVQVISILQSASHVLGDRSLVVIRKLAYIGIADQNPILQ